jgi:hypothetical protein
MTTSITDFDPKPGEIWHPWWMLEEVPANMWGDVSHRKTWLQMAIAFTGNADLYGEWMRKVADSWRHSCEHALTKTGDKRPWIGHAAVAMAIGCPEDIVREAWGHLTEEQQNKANAKAAEAIEYWRSNHAKEKPGR